MDATGPTGFTLGGATGGTLGGDDGATTGSTRDYRNQDHFDADPDRTVVIDADGGL